jgi:hypothetical protein
VTEELTPNKNRDSTTEENISGFNGEKYLILEPFGLPTKRILNSITFICIVTVICPVKNWRAKILASEKEIYQASQAHTSENFAHQPSDLIDRQPGRYSLRRDQCLDKQWT